MDVYDARACLLRGVTCALKSGGPDHIGSRTARVIAEQFSEVS